ncbi:hypothetical protein [Maribacter polysaccharolyticus]|uniref:hypothetical protein n=1 Tax=Maribacter polysaccharolyticus TaxID=3020831 RepID=UPI00237EED22|nr:hypothetical protein [Maribacter polysaccharolyticus]MDE3744056.1 hypothetical protein [Maribacter polysaccharolyticus]
MNRPSNKITYCVLSPDKFPISPDDFQTPEQAWAQFDKWKMGFSNQGYYSTIRNNVRVRITLETLRDHCNLIEYELEEDDIIPGT